MWLGVDESGARLKEILRIHRGACRYQRDRERSDDKERTRKKNEDKPGRQAEADKKNETIKKSCKLGMVYPSPSTTKTRKQARTKKAAAYSGLDFEGKKIQNQWFRSR